MRAADDRLRYQQRPCLAGYWRGGQLHVYNPGAGTEVLVPGPLLPMLDLFSVPRSIRRVADLLRLDRSLVRGATRRFLEVGLVDRAHDSSGTGSIDQWASWSPQATLFHFGTKDDRYVPEPSVRAIDAPPTPAALKPYPDAVRLPLPSADASGPLSQILLARRTWRRFSRQPISVGHVATLAGLTWGVQRWMSIKGHPPIALKTSPSGGARHSIEAYVLALRVDGLSKGLYHFDPSRRELSRLRRGASPRELARFLPQQPGYRNAAAVFVMTSVFDRVRARYPSPRAYRAILLEAGHLCQTFCLVATALGLAPFCTNAFADTVIERALGIDGVSESVVYVAGVGRRPRGVDWAPWPGREPLPKLSRPLGQPREPMR